MRTCRHTHCQAKNHQKGVGRTITKTHIWLSPEGEGKELGNKKYWKKMAEILKIFDKDYKLIVQEVQQITS